MKLAVVIPTYNEKDTLPHLIEEIIQVLKNITSEFFIIIVDDASPDGTGDIIDELSKKFNNIIPIHRNAKLGLGSAYKEGFSLALKFNSDFIIQMDADGSHDPKEIPIMIEKIQGYDFGIASRHVISSNIIGWRLGRKMIHSAAGIIASMCGRIKIRDPTSGYRIFRHDVLRSIDFTQIRSTGFSFQIELLCYLKIMGFKGIEIPTTFINRREGKSKMGRKEVIQFVNTCFYLLTKQQNIVPKSFGSYNTKE